MVQRQPRFDARNIFRHPLTFLLSAAAIYATLLALARSLSGLENAGQVALGMTADLVLTVPLLYYLMLVRGRGWPVFSVVPVFVASLAGAAAVLPAEHQGALRAVELLAIPAEILLVGFLITRAVRVARGFRGRRAGDVFESLRTSARETLGARLPAEVLAYEAATAYYAFSRRPREAPPNGVTIFSHHRKILYGTVVLGLSLAGLVEIVPVHLLVHHFWSPIAAWVLTGLSVYGLLWLAGDYRAVVARPSLVDDDTLRLRVGLRWNTEIPRAAIRRISKLDPRQPEPTGSYVRATLLGRPHHLIELDRPIAVRGVYGWRRSVETIGVTVDDDAAFERLAA